MQLTTGTVLPMPNGQYGIDNIKLIIKSLVNITKELNLLAGQEKPKGFFKRLAFWTKNIFNRKKELGIIAKDMHLLSENANTIKNEFADIVGDELQELINYTAGLIGKEEAPEFVYELPILLDSIKRIIKGIKQ